MYESQYEYIKKNKEKYRKYARDYYNRIKENPEKLRNRQDKRKKWYSENKNDQLRKQRDKKRQRKLEAIEYLGGKCQQCNEIYHPSVYEFHHRNPKEKDRDPSKMMLLSKEKLYNELDKCDLLCANCHRQVHHSWENENGMEE